MSSTASGGAMGSDMSSSDHLLSSIISGSRAKGNLCSIENLSSIISGSRSKGNLSSIGNHSIISGSRVKGNVCSIGNSSAEFTESLFVVDGKGNGDTTGPFSVRLGGSLAAFPRAIR